MPAIKDTVNLRINLNSSGTEASPYSIEQVVTDIADTSYIEQVGKVIYLKRSLDWRTGFLLVPETITVVMMGGSFYNNNNSSTTPTNGIELKGGCEIVAQSGIIHAGAGAQSGTGIIKVTQINGIYPSFRQQCGARHDTMFSSQEGFPAANYFNIIYKIDGLNIQLSNEAHIKWYTRSASSYIRNVNVQFATSYSGNPPTAIQLAYGVSLSGFRTSVFSVAGEPAFNTGECLITSPYFDIATAQALGGYFYTPTNISLVDPLFASGGSWNGQINPVVAQSGSQIRHKTTYTATVAKGSTPIEAAKLIFIPTKTGSNALSQAVTNTIFSTDAQGKIAPFTLLYKEWFPSGGGAQNSTTTTTWQILARHPLYEIVYEAQAAAGAVSSVSQTIAATDRANCTLTLSQATSVTAPYSGIALDFVTKTITLTSARTTQELFNYIQWALYQDANLTRAHFSTFIASELNISDWNITGLQFLSGKVRSTGTLSAGAAMTSLHVIGSVTQATPTNLTAITITGTLTYNTNTAASVTITDCTIGTLANSGTGLVTVTPTNSTVTTYTDAEINYLDSAINVLGSTSNTAYPTATDRNNNTNALATWAGEYKFKRSGAWASIVYLKMDVGFTAYKDVTLTTGQNVVDLGTTGLLSVIQATMAKEATLLQTEADIISAIGSGLTLAQIEASTVLAKEATGAAIKAKTDQLSINGQGHVAANVHQLQAGALADIANSVEAEIERSGGMLDTMKADTGAIKLKTNSLTFSQPNVIDANIKYVNDIQVKGTGQESDPWNPI
jgi:hypothetical protein